MDELLGLGFELSYQSLTRKIRDRGLRPVCQARRTAVQCPNAVITHPPGEETQFDWLELPDARPGWGSQRAFLFVGSLAHSGKWRAMLAPSMDQPHLLEALSTVVSKLGWVSKMWRFDRMATVCHPAQRGAERGLRRVRQALQGPRGDLSAAGGTPQGRGGVGQPHRRPTLVGNPARRDDVRDRPGLRGRLRGGPVAEQGLDPALVVLRLTHRYSAERVEAACRLALPGRVRSPRYAHLRPILETGQDKIPGRTSPPVADSVSWYG